MIPRDIMDRFLAGADLHPQEQAQQVPERYLGRFFSGFEMANGAKQMVSGTVSVILVPDQNGNPTPMLAVKKQELNLLPVPPGFFGT
jgi:hypothetical protein